MSEEEYQEFLRDFPVDEKRKITVKLWQAANLVKSRKQFGYIRKSKTQPDLVEFSFKHISGGTILDGTTSSMFLAVYENLNDKNKSKMDSMNFESAIGVAWRIINS